MSFRLPQYKTLEKYFASTIFTTPQHLTSNVQFVGYKTTLRLEIMCIRETSKVRGGRYIMSMTIVFRVSFYFHHTIGHNMGGRVQSIKTSSLTI